MKKFVIIAMDELGDDFNPSEEVYCAPSGCTTEEAYILAEKWLRNRYEGIKERFPECTDIHVEPLYSQMTYTEMCEYMGDWYY